MPLVATVAHLLCRHLPVRPPARWARLRLAPAPGAGLRAVSHPATTCALRVARHPGGNRVTHMVLDKVLAPTLAKLKVARVVVRAVMVQMVHDLPPKQAPPNLLLHHQSVLHHPAMLRGVRVVGHVGEAVRAPAELPNLCRADWWRLPGGYFPSILRPDKRKAWPAADGGSLVGPADDRGSTSGAREGRGWLWFRHAAPVTGARTERKSQQQAEWLTLSREPSWRPAVQRSLFGAP